MKNEKTPITVIEGPKAATKTTKPAKKATKKTTKAKKSVKKAAKKIAKPTIERKTSVFSLAAKAKVDDLGAGQRAAIAKVLKKTGGATRTQLVAALPSVPPPSISWWLSMMIKHKIAKKTVQK
jgi:hypothetical protein